ncbi:unannotated protein [freshwater metagenome]|uniref:Unannotated protein n=1 Tax=freshwater metagenome TaxID=449393 RepID=A0A6J7UNU7_9ZZZZ|nr:glycosyltransferase [Actinomycetota bacterium]
MTTTTRRIGKYIAFVPAHCKLEREFRTEMGRWLRASSFDMVYGDSLHPTDDKYEEPIQVLRPGWSPERLRGHCYVGDVVLAAADLVARVGGADALCSLSSHHRALLLSEHASSIGRMPLFLYSAPWEHRFPSADLDAVTSHCLRTGIHAQCSLNDSGSGVVVKRTRNNDPSVTVIIPTRGTEAEVRGKNRVLAAHAIAQLVEHSAFQNFDIIVIVDEETPAHALHEINNAAPGRTQIVPFDRPFNFAEKVNLGVAHTTADYLLLLNDDTEPSNPHLIDTLLSYFSDDTVGLVGPKLLYEDGSIQSAGHFFNPVPYDSYRGFPGNCAGAYNMLTVAREVSSVIAACALTPRKVFIEVGGLSTLFPGDYNDIDFALKLQLVGKRVLYTPYTDCFHFESKTREAKLNPTHVALLGERWRDQLENETYGHPSLQKYQVAWKANRPGQRSVDEAVGPTAPMASK